MQTNRRALLALLLAIVIFCPSCFKSKNVVKKVGDPRNGSLKLDGVTYALPRTVLQARVPFKRTDSAPGEFEMYTPCFYSPEVAAGRIREKSTSFGIGDSVLSSRGEPDPSEHYIAKIKGGYFENKTLFLEFNSEGVITKGEAKSENMAIDVAISAVKTGVSVLATAIGGGGAKAGAARTETLDPNARDRVAIDINLCRAAILTEAINNAASAGEAFIKMLDQTGVNKIDVQDARNAAGAVIARARATQQRLSSGRKVISDALASGQKTAQGKSPLEESDDLVEDVITESRKVSADLRNAEQKAHTLPKVMENGADEIEAIGKAAAEIDSKVDTVGTRNDEVGTNTSPGQAFADDYEEAKMRFDRIGDLRRSREKLVTGETVPMGLSADALQKLLDESDNLIKAYENTYFMGTKDSDSWTAGFDFRPGKTHLTKSYNLVQTSPVLIWFSKSKGLCPTDETREQGVRIKPSFLADACPQAAGGDRKGVLIEIQRLVDEHQFLYEMARANRREERNGERGFYYRIPARVITKLTVTAISDDDAKSIAKNSLNGQNWDPDKDPPADPFLLPAGPELTRGTMRIAQMGVIASIPASAAGRTTQYTIDFDESTGALKNFKLASNALLEKSIVEEAGAAASDVVKAKQERDKKKEEATDELAKKKRELDLLKTENEINAEKKKLEAAQPAPSPSPEP